MRRGRVFRRCSSCGATIAQRPCERCGGDRWSWYYVVDVAAPGFQRDQRMKGGFATKAAAVDAMTELQRAIASGTHVEPSALTVGEYLDAWLPTAQARLRPGAFAVAELHVRAYLLPRLGSVPLQRLTSTRIKAFYGELGANGRVRDPSRALSRKTVHNVHRTLSRALKDAVADRLLLRNPAEGLHRQPESPEIPSWTALQLQQFLETTGEDRLAALWRVAAMTGMRRGELAGLRWRDVDLDAGRVTVVQQLAKGLDGEVAPAPTKTRRSRRLITLDAETVAVLRAHRRQQVREQLLLGPAYQESGYVFTRVDGSPLHPDRITQMFRELVRAHPLPPISVHGLRHTHATLMLQAGIHPKVVQERLGHSSIAITLDIYSHAVPAMQEDAASRLASLLDEVGQRRMSEGAGEV